LTKDVAERKAKMEKSPRRKEGSLTGTDTEREYGVAMSLFIEYVNDLKAEANKRTLGETIEKYKANPVDFVVDGAGALKSAAAGLDNSFLGRQGWRTFLKGLTHPPSMVIWTKTAVKSFKFMWDTFQHKRVMRSLFADMVSDPDYDLLKKAKVALDVIEEELPSDLPSKLPVVGMAYRMGANAFVGSSRYMRYALAKQYFNVWRKSGRPLDKANLIDIGRLANSQTGRGDTGTKSQKPGFIDNVFWSTRNLKAHIDTLTAHLFNRNMSWYAKRIAATNLLRYISGAAIILAIADWIDDDSVTWDTNSADFGKIRIGNTRFSVGGGMEILIILASRLITRKFTSSTTGKTVSLDTNKFGALSGGDLVFNFLENKFSPAAQMVWNLYVEGKTREGEDPTFVMEALKSGEPMVVRNIVETKNAEDAANLLVVTMAEIFGWNVQTYSGKKKKVKGRSRI